MSRRVLDDVSSSPIRQMHRDKGEGMECVGMEGDEVVCVQRHEARRGGWEVLVEQGAQLDKEMEMF